MRIILTMILLALFSMIAQAQFEPVIKWVTVTITRDSNAAIYVANDAVSDDASSPSLLVFQVARENGGTGEIVSAILLTDTSNTANGTFDLVFYSDSASVTVGGDTAAFALTAVRRAKFFTKMAFTLAGYGTGSTGSYAITNNNPHLRFECIPSSKNIYGQLVATGAYQPKAAGIFTIKLGIIQR